MSDDEIRIELEEENPTASDRHKLTLGQAITNESRFKATDISRYIGTSPKIELNRLLKPEDVGKLRPGTRIKVADYILTRTAYASMGIVGPGAKPEYCIYPGRVYEVLEANNTLLKVRDIETHREIPSYYGLEWFEKPW